MNWIGTNTPSLIIPYDQVLKDHLCVSDDALQGLITQYIKSVGEQLEKKVGYPLRYTAILVYSDPKYSCMILPKNIGTISKYEYMENGVWVEQTIDNINIIRLDAHCEAISLSFKNGYTYKITASATVDTQETIKTAAMLMVAENFENKENKEVKSTYNKSIDYLLGNVTCYAG